MLDITRNSRGFFIILSVMFFGGVQQTKCSIITSVGYVFETFSPYATIRFFEFSDKGWNISENCLKDMYNYLEGLRRETIWAIKLYDATSYYGGGAIGSNNLRIHNPSLCRGLLQEYKKMRESTPWKLLDFNGSVVPFPVHIILGHYLLEIGNERVFKTEKIQQLICFPQSCDHGDLQQILDIYLFQSNNVVKNNTYMRHRVLNDNFNILNDFDFYIIISLLLSSIFLFVGVFVLENSVFATNCIICQDTRHPKEAVVENVLNSVTDFKELFEQSLKSEPVIKPVSPNKSVYFTSIPNLPRIVSAQKSFYIQEILDAMSIQNVVYNVFQQQSNEVPTAQPVLFIVFAMLVTYAHVAAEIRFMSNNVQPANQADFWAKSPTYLMDIYFLISGSKLAHQFFKTFPHEKLNVFEQLMHVLSLILQKIFSLVGYTSVFIYEKIGKDQIVYLTPSYAFALFTERLLAKYFHNNIVLEIPSYDVSTCRMNIWSNILYMDTFFPLSERCMPWTWFISLEVQFFIIACLVLLLAEIKPKYGVIIGISLFTVSVIAASFTEAQSYKQQRFGNHEADIIAFNLIYENICLRIAPYLLGICLGYILQKTNSSLTLNVFIIICGWIAAFMLACFLLFGQQLALFATNHLIRAIMATLGHTMWSLIVFWIVLASIAQNGEFLTIFAGHKFFDTLAKVSPISLLIGPIVIRLFIFSADIPIYSAEGHIFIIGLGCLLVIYACALALYILFDGPLVAVMDVIIKRR